MARVAEPQVINASKRYAKYSWHFLILCIAEHIDTAGKLFYIKF